MSNADIMLRTYCPDYFSYHGRKVLAKIVDLPTRTIYVNQEGTGQATRFFPVERNQSVRALKEASL